MLLNTNDKRMNIMIKRTNRIVLFKYYFYLPIVVLLTSFISCASDSSYLSPEDAEWKDIESNGHINAEKPISIFVFMDGTGNDPKIPTNIFRLFDVLKQNKDSNTVSIYIEGVGSIDNQLWGGVLGQGMKERIIRGYTFITEHYKPGDKIYIFGFSRGALTARSLAGLIAYSGIPQLSSDEKNKKQDLYDLNKKIMELTQHEIDNKYDLEWASWRPDQRPLISHIIKEEIDKDVLPAQIELLGVWDTVPGSQFKDFFDKDEMACKESIGFVKEYFWWLPMITRGERYKTDSYPPIRKIAHALSYDEKRTVLRPLRICEPINEKYTIVQEIWFPGAHADVGGGYEEEDANDLPNISLNWMIETLSESYNFAQKPQTFKEKYLGLAHWSYGDFPGNIDSECRKRNIRDNDFIHESVDKRVEAGKVLPISVCVAGSEYEKEYVGEECKQDTSQSGKKKIVTINQFEFTCKEMIKIANQNE